MRGDINGPGRILIIDDDPSVAEGLQMFLECEGMEVFVHRSPITAPLGVRQMNPDLILLDLSMPALSGETFLQAGGRRMLGADVPVLLFSGRAPSELARLTEELGADGFVSKQEEIAEIARIIISWVERTRALRMLALRGSDEQLAAARRPSHRIH